MKAYFSNILPHRIPKNINPADQLLVLRERILQMILMAIAMLGAILYLLLALQTVKRSPIFTNLVGTTVLILLGLAIFRQISFKVRSFIVIVVFYVLTFTSLISYGVEGSGMLLAMAFSVIVFLLRGTNAGIILSLLNIATVTLVGWMMISGIVAPPPAEYEISSTMFSGWMITGLAFIVLIAALMVTVITMVRGLQGAIDQQKTLSQELLDERNNLEARVSQRSKEYERRAAQWETASTIAREISQETDLDLLLNRSVELIRERFDLYYVALFLIDENNENAVLRSGTGDAGRIMLENHHQLKIGQVGMVGHVISKNEFRLAQDVKSDPTHYNNPYLPATQSELALPLRLEGKVIGVLDLQSTQKGYFGTDDIKVIQISADQIAIAIQRSRLVEQLKQSLESMEIGLKQFTQQSWKTYLKSTRQQYAYRFTRGSIEEDVVFENESLKTVESGKPSVQTSPGNTNTSLAIPIRLRNQVLGVLNIRFDGQKIPAELMPVLETTSDRLGLALENARLLDEIKTRIGTERMVSDISTRVRSASNIDSVLKTAAAELGRNLGISEVVVQLKTSD